MHFWSVHCVVSLIFDPPKGGLKPRKGIEIWPHENVDPPDLPKGPIPTERGQDGCPFRVLRDERGPGLADHPVCWAHSAQDADLPCACAIFWWVSFFFVCKSCCVGQEHPSNKQKQSTSDRLISVGPKDLGWLHGVISPFAVSRCLDMCECGLPVGATRSVYPGHSRHRRTVTVVRTLVAFSPLLRPSACGTLYSFEDHVTLRIAAD